MTLLLVFGAALGDLDSPTAGSSVALLLAGSVLFATVVARRGEQRLLRAIFAGPRWLLSIGAIAALAALAAAASVAYGADDGLRDVVTGRLPPGGRPAASLIVRSAEGLPNRNLGIDVRAEAHDGRAGGLAAEHRAA